MSTCIADAVCVPGTVCIDSYCTQLPIIVPLPTCMGVQTACDELWAAVFIVVTWMALPVGLMALQKYGNA